MNRLVAQVVENASLLLRRFVLSSHSVTRAPPHIRDANNVQRLWNYFVIASIPSFLIGLWNLGHQLNLAIAAFAVDPAPGWRAALLVKTGIGLDSTDIMACVAHGALYFLPIFIVALLVGAFWESLFAALRKKRVDEGLLYIAWFVALMMPADAPLYQVAHGMSFGIVFGKLIYGGSGRYLVNPAMFAIAFLVFSYSELMFAEGAWVPVEGYDQPTALEFVPTTPNPTSGFIILVPKQDTIELDMEVDEAVKLVMSLGVVVPRWTKAETAELPLKMPAE